MEPADEHGGATSGITTIPIRGQGTWTIKALVKASGVAGSCPYGASSSLAGPQLQASLSSGLELVVPADASKPDQYWICTAPAGTYDYTPVQGTFVLNDGNWTKLSVVFKANYATTGTVWWDNVVIQAPDGRTVRLLGDGGTGGSGGAARGIMWPLGGEKCDRRATAPATRNRQSGERSRSAPPCLSPAPQVRSRRGAPGGAGAPVDRDLPAKPPRPPSSATSLGRAGGAR